MKNIVVTGGNSGIGLQTARGLYADGHNIIIGSRNNQKNIEAIQDITTSHPQSKGRIRYFALDLAKRESVEKFVDYVKKQFTLLDILINNSGLMVNERQISEIGAEMTYTINHFGPFYLTYLLFPLLKNSQQARIINLSSASHFGASQSLANDITCSNKWSSYGVYQKSKLGNVQFTAALADKLKNNPRIKAMSLHPGVVSTDFQTKICWLNCFRYLCCCCCTNPVNGARTSLHLSRIQFDLLRSGQFYDSNTEIKEMNPIGRNKAQNQKLWQESEKLYGIKFQV